MLYFALLLKCN